MSEEQELPQEPTEEQLKALDEISAIGQEIQPEYYALSSSSATPAPAKKKTRKKKTAKKKTEAKKKEEPTPVVEEKTEAFTIFTKDECPDDRWLVKQQRNADVRELGIAEFFYVFNSLATKDQRIILLRKAKSDPVMMTLLNINFAPQQHPVVVPSDAEIQSCRPSTLPWGLSPYTIRNQIRRIKLLLKNSPGDTTDVAKSRMFCEFMESLHPAEAQILYHASTQKLTEIAPELTPSLVKAAFGNTRFPNL